MENVTIREVQHNLATYMKRVELGEEILISRRKHPIAKIVPLSEKDEEKVKNRRLHALKSFKGIAVGKKRSPNIDSWLKSERDSWAR